MDLKSALLGLEDARFIINEIQTNLRSELEDPAVAEVLHNKQAVEKDIMSKLVSGYLDELEEYGQGDPTVAGLVHNWLGITDKIDPNDTTAKGRWLDHLGDIVKKITEARERFHKLSAALSSAEENKKVHELLTVSRIAVESAKKSLTVAYILALEAGGASRAKELYNSVSR